MLPVTDAEVLGRDRWERLALMVFAGDDQREFVIWKKEISLGGAIYNLGKKPRVALDMYQNKGMDVEGMKGYSNEN